MVVYENFFPIVKVPEEFECEFECTLLKFMHCPQTIPSSFVGYVGLFNSHTKPLWDQSLNEFHCGEQKQFNLAQVFCLCVMYRKANNVWSPEQYMSNQVSSTLDSVFYSNCPKKRKKKKYSKRCSESCFLSWKAHNKISIQIFMKRHSTLADYDFTFKLH